ncbi:KxYKxGKxW signal peptide domain-containing protein [Novosphingobium sp. BW1]
MKGKRWAYASMSTLAPAMGS